MSIHKGKAIQEIAYHLGHEVEVATYQYEQYDIRNACIECVTCGTVLIDGEMEEMLWDEMEANDNPLERLDAM